MTTEKIFENIRKYVSEKPSNWIEQADKYEENKEWLEKSSLIAIKILRTIRSESITQKELAESIGVTSQYINKVVKGNENLTLETICKIERSLGISLVSVPVYEMSKVILDSFIQAPSLISRHESNPIVSKKSEYIVESKYQPQEEPIAA